MLQYFCHLCYRSIRAGQQVFSKIGSQNFATIIALLPLFSVADSKPTPVSDRIIFYYYASNSHINVWESVGKGSRVLKMNSQCTRWALGKSKRATVASVHTNVWESVGKGSRVLKMNSQCTRWALGKSKTATVVSVQVYDCYFFF